MAHLHFYSLDNSKTNFRFDSRHNICLSYFLLSCFKKRDHSSNFPVVGNCSVSLWRLCKIAAVAPPTALGHLISSFLILHYGYSSRYIWFILQTAKTFARQIKLQHQKMLSKWVSKSTALLRSSKASFQTFFSISLPSFEKGRLCKINKHRFALL